MLNINEKYWINLENLYIKCTIKKAFVLASYNYILELKSKGLISEKELEQVEKDFKVKSNYTTIIEGDIIKKLSEVGGFVVFYDIDEPIGNSLTEEEFVKDINKIKGISKARKKEKRKDLKKLRRKKIKFIVSTWGLTKEESKKKRIELEKSYPEKDYGNEWRKKY